MPESIRAELSDLFWSLADGTYAPEDVERLEALAAEYSEVRSLYAKYMVMCGQLRWARSEHAADEPAHFAVPAALPSQRNARQIAGDRSRGGRFSLPSFGSLAAMFSPDTRIGNVVISYGSAAILLGTILFIASRCTMQTGAKAVAERHPSAAREANDKLAQELKPTVDSDSVQLPVKKRLTKQPAFVGRITGEADCQWKLVGGGQCTVDRKAEVPEIPKSRNPEIPNLLVAFGDKLIVASGLLEITYDSGAKVMLQGPCRFNVETNGGFLAIGRLTGQMEKSGQWTVDSAKLQAASNQKSLATSHQPLATSFVIATPTAIVTDLGTEFGVEVDRTGASEVHVLRGKVDAKFLDANGGVFKSVALRQGEARHYDQRAKQVASVSVDHEKYGELQFEAMQKRSFSRWTSFSHVLRQDPSLTAYYPFENVNVDSATLKNASLSGKVLDGHIVGATWTRGHLPGKSSLWFHAPGDRVALPHPERFAFRKGFSVAVRFQVEGYAGPKHALIAKGDLGWRILQRSDISGITFDTNSGPIENSSKLYDHFGQVGIGERSWHYAVAVYKPDRFADHKYIYIDGQLDMSGDVPSPMTQTDEPVWIGNNSQHPKRVFCGWIDEVAIFSRPLSSEEVAAMSANNVAGWRRLHGEVNNVPARVIAASPQAKPAKSEKKGNSLW